MSMSPNVSGYGRIIHFAGAAIPVAAADPPASVNVSAQDGVTAWVKIVADAATNIGIISVQVVDSYDGSAGSWIPNTVNAAAMRSDYGTASFSGSSTVALTVTGGFTYWLKLQTANTQMGIGGASVLVWGDAAGSGDDEVSVYFASIEGV